MTDTQTTQKMNAETFLESVGRKALSDKLGVGLTALSNASVANKFSNSWYEVIKEISKKEGLEFPKHLFNMRGRSADQEQVR